MADRRPRGKLTIYLGYAAGVGKTYQMLEEVQEMKRQGKDVVVGYFEPHVGRADTITKTQGLEIIPRRKVEYRGTVFEEMDTDAILRRLPGVCVVDELPHSNAPGSDRAKRWQDVEMLIEAGIDVVTTMNIQHLESLNDQVRQITGIRAPETIPDWVMQRADQVVMVDLTPRALLKRLARGVVYPPDQAKTALEHFFQESRLVALRGLALRQTAHEVEIRQVDEDSADEAEQARQGLDRILILITPDPSTVMLIRRAKRVADNLRAGCLAVAVCRHVDLRDMAAGDREAVERHLDFARSLHIDARVLQGHDIASTVVGFARLNDVTQMFLARPARSQQPALLGRNLVQQVVHLARDMQVTIVADRGRAGAEERA